MKIVIAGGSGFLGRALADRLAAAGHDLVVLTRAAAPPPLPPRASAVTWSPDGQAGPWSAALDGAGAVVNLAGESIAAHRWSEAHKRRVLESRVDATRSLAAAIRGAASPPAVFVSGSAVGYYGPRGDEIVTEEAGRPAATSSRASRCSGRPKPRAPPAPARAWPASAPASCWAPRAARCPRCCCRSSSAPAGPVGSGRQYWPWIHRDDWVSLVEWAIGERRGERRRQRDGAEPGDQRRLRPRPRTRAPSSGVHAGAGVRAANRRSERWPTRCCCRASARCRPGPSGSGFTFRYPAVDLALAALFPR